jgi:[ribosomal protein S5]-alanine N-acetyltransferase
MQDTHIIFETERLLVRRYTNSDGDNIFSLGGNADVMRYIRAVQTKEQSDVFLVYNMNFYKEQPMMGRWAVEEKTTGKFVGSFAVIFIEGTKLIQLGYSLLPNEWGKGYATELTKAGLQYVFEKMKLPLIYGVTEVGNIASQQVLLKAGFNKEMDFKEGEKDLIRFVITNENKLPD